MVKLISIYMVSLLIKDFSSCETVDMNFDEVLLNIVVGFLFDDWGNYQNLPYWIFIKRSFLRMFLVFRENHLGFHYRVPVSLVDIVEGHKVEERTIVSSKEMISFATMNSLIRRGAIKFSFCTTVDYFKLFVEDVTPPCPYEIACTGPVTFTIILQNHVIAFYFFLQSFEVFVDVSVDVLWRFCIIDVEDVEDIVEYFVENSESEGELSGYSNVKIEQLENRDVLIDVQK